MPWHKPKKEIKMNPDKHREDRSEMNAGEASPERDREGALIHSMQSPELGTRRCQESGLDENLRVETLKWLEKAEVLSCQVSGDEHFLENVSAYIRDSHYFLEKGDLIRAFEAVIWAWAWMEIGLEKGLLQQKE